jgi:hypothetical protein
VSEAAAAEAEDDMPGFAEGDGTVAPLAGGAAAKRGRRGA